MLTGQGYETEQTPIFKIVDAALLKLPYYDSDINWGPRAYNETLAQTIQLYLNSPKRSYEQIALEHLKSGNLESFNRMISAGVINEDSFSTSIDTSELLINSSLN
ncbi:MAG: hypothetical protein IPH20_14400 [Bacteroidales bacterium]|nr:hypothetical protein [Bacteroidales bacterium]